MLRVDRDFAGVSTGLVGPKYVVNELIWTGAVMEGGKEEILAQAGESNREMQTVI
jgi:hypothetical protein